MTPAIPPASWTCLQALAPADIPPGPLTPADLVARLKAAGTRVRVVEAESLEELTQATEGGGMVVLFVNAGLLWGDPAAVDGGEANHCVLAKGLTDAGATLHDPARPPAGPVPADTLVAAWLQVGGRMLAAD